MGTTINAANTSSAVDPYAGLESFPDILAASGDLSNRREHRLGLAAAAQVLNDAGVKGFTGGSYSVTDLEIEMTQGRRSIDDVAKAHGIDPASVPRRDGQLLHERRRAGVGSDTSRRHRGEHSRSPALTCSGASTQKRIRKLQTTNTGGVLRRLIAIV